MRVLTNRERDTIFATFIFARREMQPTVEAILVAGAKLGDRMDEEGARIASWELTKAGHLIAARSLGRQCPRCHGSGRTGDRRFRCSACQGSGDALEED